MTKFTMDDGWVENFNGAYENFGYAVVFSPNGAFIASVGTYDATVRVWDAATGVCRHALAAHPNPVEEVIFSPDSKFVISSCGTRTMISEAETGECHGVFDAERGLVALSPNSALIAFSERRSERICLWDATTSSQRYLPAPPTRSSWAVSIRFSPDSQKIASVDRLGKVYVWTLKDPMIPIVARGFCRYSLACFSPDGRHLALKIENYHPRPDSLVLWNFQTDERRSVDLPRNGITSLVYSPDSKYIAAFNGDIMAVVNAQTVQLQYTLHACQSFKAAAFSSDSRLLAIACSDMTLMVDDIETGWTHKLRVGAHLSRHQKTLQILSFDQTGRYLTTDVGVIDLDLSPRVSGHITDEPYHDPVYMGPGLLSDGGWIVRGSEKIVRLPDNIGRAAKTWAVSGPTFAVSYAPTKVWVFDL